MSAPPTAAPSPGARVLRVALGLVAGLVAWVYADLYFRVDLPGARHLTYWAFQAVTRPLALLGEDFEAPLVLLAQGWVVGAVVTLPVRRARTWFWRLSAVGGAAGLALTLATAFLMERSLAAGLVVAVLVATRMADPPRRTGAVLPAWSWAPWMLAGCLLCLYYPYSLVFSVPEGYPLLEAIGAAVRHDAVRPLEPMLALSAVVAAGSWTAVAQRGWQHLAPAVAGLLTWAVVGVVVHDHVQWDVGSATALAASGAATWAFHQLSSVPWTWDPRTWVVRTTPVALGTLFLFGHAYAARVFECPEPQDYPELQVIGDTPGVFRLQANGDASHAVMSVRSRLRVESVPLAPEPGDIHVAYQLATWATEPLPWAAPEDLAWAPDPSRFFVMLSMRDETTWLGETDGDRPPIRAALLTLNGDGTSVLDLSPMHGLCWTSALEWHGESLYVGCERPWGLFRWQPRPGGIRPQDVQPAVDGSQLGDVESIAFHPDGDLLYTASLWTSPFLHELGIEDLAVRRRAFVGGGHYVVAQDPVASRLFLSSFYSSRIRILDAETLELTGSIPTGLGARGLAVDAERGLVVSSSLYNGQVQVADSATGEMLRVYPVGGHVKDIAVDSARGLAYFWGQCGLQRLDLQEATGRERRP